MMLTEEHWLALPSTILETRTAAFAAGALIWRRITGILRANLSGRADTDLEPSLHDSRLKYLPRAANALQALHLAKAVVRRDELERGRSCDCTRSLSMEGSVKYASSRRSCLSIMKYVALFAALPLL